MKRFFGAFILIFAALVITGCKKEDPNPELLDPIYQDLSKRETDAQKSFEEEVAKQKDLRITVQKLEARSPELRNAWRDLNKSIETATRMEQRARYYRIRAKRRMLVDRITYKKAFAKDLPWPDPHEYSDYQVNNRLREVPLNWNTRVPKLTTRGVASAPAKGEKAKEAKKEE